MNRERWTEGVGDEIAFSSDMPFTLNLFSTKDRAADELILCVERARSERSHIR